MFSPKITRSHSSQEELIRNVSANIKLDIPRLRRGPDAGPIAVVGGGPSLASQLDKIRTFRTIMAAGSSHDYLVRNGIVPTYAVAADARDDTLDYYRRPNHQTTYLLASQCSPGLFNNLQRHRVVMWHLQGQIPKEHFHGENPIVWGCMVGVHCIQVALILGFREQHFFGVDCSLADKSHAYDVRESGHLLAEGTTFVIDGREFDTTAGLVCQAQAFVDLFRDERSPRGFVYGGGMLPAIVRRSAMPRLEAR